MKSFIFLFAAGFIVARNHTQIITPGFEVQTNSLPENRSIKEADGLSIPVASEEKHNRQSGVLNGTSDWQDLKMVVDKPVKKLFLSGDDFSFEKTHCLIFLQTRSRCT